MPRTHRANSHLGVWRIHRARTGLVPPPGISSTAGAAPPARSPNFPPCHGSAAASRRLPPPDRQHARRADRETSSRSREPVSIQWCSGLMALRHNNRDQAASADAALDRCSSAEGPLVVVAPAVVPLASAPPAVAFIDGSAQAP